MLTPESFDLLKMVLEKGLLALALLGAGAYAARRLEQFKARNTYSQVIAEQRIEAYKEGYETLQKQHMMIFDLIRAFQVLARATNESEERQAADGIHEQRRAVITDMQQSVPQLLRCTLFYSRRLGDLLIAYTNELVLFFAAFDFEGDSAGELLEHEEKLIDTIHDIQRQMHEELHQHFVSR